MPRIDRRRSTYPPRQVDVGIVHLGLGAFHRAHQAVYLERWLDRNRGGEWGICAANIRSNREIVDRLTAGHCRYHVVEYRDREHVRIAEVQAIREALFAGEDRAPLIARMLAPGTRIVSLTVTEKGYCLQPASGELDPDDPGIAHDLARPKQARTAPGILLEAIRQRRRAGHPPFTVLSCDNMPANGARTRRAVLALAGQQSAALARWIDDNVPFPSSMVDRIVPAMTAEREDELAGLIGEPDPAAIACEAFSQWVIEDRFVAGRPDWENDGVEMVDDVQPFETMKLRLLNGAHSLLAYIGLARGKTTVAAAVADPALNALVREYFAEAAATLAPAAGLDPKCYQSALLERFGNDALEHRLEQIAMDGSQKLPQRWLDGALENLRQDRPISVTAEAVAAWMAYVRGENDSGASWRVDDPLAPRLAGCHRSERSVDDTVAALLAVREVFPAALAERDDFRAAVRAAYARLKDADADR